MDDAEFHFLRTRIAVALTERKLSAWQRTFLTDMQAKLDRYGNRARLTEKQLQRLREIVGDINVVPFRPPAQRAPFAAHRRWRPRRRSFLEREARWWTRRLLRDVAFAAAFFIAFLVFSAFDKIPSWSFSTPDLGGEVGFGEQSFTITDGDTVRLADGTAVRLVGFNTPEKFEPQCSREAALGNQASERLRQLVASGTATVTRVACSCKPGTEGTDKCNHGRSCGTLTVDGRDVGDILISEGLAVPFICGKTSCPRTPKPWCR